MKRSQINSTYRLYFIYKYSKNPTRKCLEMINNFSKVARYKMNLKLYTNKNHVKGHDFGDTLICDKKVRINLIKMVKTSALKLSNKDIRKWKDLSCS